MAFPRTEVEAACHQREVEAFETSLVLVGIQMLTIHTEANTAASFHSQAFKFVPILLILAACFQCKKNSILNHQICLFVKEPLRFILLFQRLFNNEFCFLLILCGSCDCLPFPFCKVLRHFRFLCTVTFRPPFKPPG